MIDDKERLALPALNVYDLSPGLLVSAYNNNNSASLYYRSTWRKPYYSTVENIFIDQIIDFLEFEDILLVVDVSKITEHITLQTIKKIEESERKEEYSLGWKRKRNILNHHIVVTMLCREKPVYVSCCTNVGECCRMYSRFIPALTDAKN